MIAGILVATVVALLIAMWLPGRDVDQADGLPWQITPTIDGSSRVFGLELGLSTLSQAEYQFREPANITMFVQPDIPPVVEAYFDQVTLAGIRAQIVATIEVDEALIQQLFHRGSRIEAMEGGGKKVSLSSDDLALIRQQRIASLTYIPKSRLEPDVIYRRFGEPEQRINEGVGVDALQHWLYPQRGLDIILAASGRVVMQYLPPRSFERIVQPLQQLSTHQP